MRTKLKAVDVAIEAGDKKAATEALKAAVPHVDRLARKGILHMNNAARKKSRLNTAIRAL
jgi:small subunit ribosomal protein S20